MCQSGTLGCNQESEIKVFKLDNEKHIALSLDLGLERKYPYHFGLNY